MAIQQSDITTGLAEIYKLSTEELKELVNSDQNNKFDEIADQSEKVKNLENEREVLLASVKSLAEFNLARQSDYEADRSKLLTLVGESNKLKEEIENKATTLLELSRKTSLESTLAVVLAAAGKAEEESENLAKSFLSGDLDYESFNHNYCDKRKLAHLRRIKADKLRQETNESWTGHTGIADSRGVIHDFGGSYFVAVDSMTFGRPTKITKLDSRKVRGRNWDEAIKISAQRFCERPHNIAVNNCHNHVADTLNEMKYDGYSDWNQFHVWWLITWHSKYISCKGFLYQWGIFLCILAVIVILVLLSIH